MSFKISDFKTTMDKYGGPARLNLFEVRLENKSTEPGVGTDMTREISFFCTNVNFPGVAVEQGMMTNVAQLPTSFPLRMTPQPISGSFLLDSNHNVLSFFHNWLQRVMNYSTKGGTFGGIDADGDEVGQLPYELGYKDQYACRMTIRHYSTESLGKGSEAKYYETVLDNIYPTTIADMQLSWDSNDQFATLPVTFAYDQIHYSGDRTGVPSQRKKGGLLETLSDLASFIDVTKQTIGQGKITSVQDAINRLQRVRNSYDNLSDFFAEDPKANKAAEVKGGFTGKVYRNQGDLDI